MSFSFTANNVDKAKAKEAVDAQRASNPNLPESFADVIKDQIDTLPDGVEINLVCHGHTGWQENQISGEVSLHLQLQVQTRPNG